MEMSKRKLPLFCPSNDDPGREKRFHVRACEGASCCLYGETGCTAGADTTETFKVAFISGDLPACPLEERCAWNVEARARGEAGCAPRSIGMICEHQGGEWNTFEMVPPEEWDPPVLG